MGDRGRGHLLPSLPAHITVVGIHRDTGRTVRVQRRVGIDSIRTGYLMRDCGYWVQFETGNQR